MAELKVQVLVERGAADQALSELDQKLRKLEQSPIKLKFQATGLDNVSKQAIQLANAQARVESAHAKAEAAAARAASANARLASAQARVQVSANQLAGAQERTAQSANRVAAEQAKADAAASRAATGVNQLESSYNKLGVTVANFAKYKLFSAITSGISDSIGEMRKLDDELVTIRKVADATEEELSAISERSYEVGGKYGKAPSDYAAGVAEFTRAGYRETSEALAELSIKAQLVGDMNAETANQFLIATDAAYGYKGSITQLSAVLDGMNAIDNNFATSIEKISAGLGKVAPIASQAHVGVDELAAAIGTITAVTQRSGEEAATALRALFLNIMGDTKTEIEDGVTWTAGEIDGLRDILERYAPAAVRAAEATGQVINPMEAMRGLAQSMREGLLSEQELMQMVTDIGGKLRSSQLLAIVQKWDMYESMLSEYQNAAGSADQEVSKMLDSWSVKAEQLRTSFTKMLSGLADSGTAKSALDMLQGVVKVLDTDLGRAGIMGVAVASGIAGITTAAKTAGPAIASFGKSFGWIAVAVTALSLLGSAMDAMIKDYDELVSESDQAQQTYEAEKSKLEEVNAQLQANKERIEELEGMGSLTYVEEAELERLKQVTAELEAQKALYEENARSSAIASADTAAQALEKLGLYSGREMSNLDAMMGDASLEKLIDLYGDLTSEEAKAELGAEQLAEEQENLRSRMAEVASEYKKHIDNMKEGYEIALAKPDADRTAAEKNIITAYEAATAQFEAYTKWAQAVQAADNVASQSNAQAKAQAKAEQLRESAAAYKEAANEYYQGLKEEQQSWEELVDSEGAYDYGHVETLNRLNGELEAYEKAQKAINDLVKSNTSDDDLHALVDTLWAADERLGSDASDSLLNYAFGIRDAAKAIEEANTAAEASVEIFNSTAAGEKALDVAATASVTEPPVVPPAPPPETYQNLSDAIENATNNYIELLDAQKEVAATGLITEETFKALEDAGYKFSEVLKDDITGGLWVSKEELDKFTNDAEDRVNQLRGTEFDWDKEIDTPEISTEPVDAFTAALQAAQKELSELEKMLSGMGESGDAFRGFSDTYKDLLSLGESGRTGTNEFAYKFDLIASDSTKAKVGNDAKKAVEFLNDEVTKALLDGQMDGNELAEYIFGKGFKGTEKAFVKMGDGIGVFLDRIDWKQWSDETGIAEDVLKSIMGVMDEYDDQMKEVGNATEDASKKVEGLDTAGTQGANGIKKINVDSIIKESAKAGKSVEEITKQIKDLQKQADKGEIELEGDTTDLEKKIDKAIKEVEDVTNDGDYTVTVEGDVDDALNAIDTLESEVKKLCETNWVMTVTIQTVGGLPSTSGLLAGGSSSAVDGGVVAADGGKAYSAGTTLVGEIEPEIIVDRSAGTWRLVPYPQITALESGDIVFNGEQTRAILAGQPTTFSQNVIGGKSYATGSASSKVAVLSTMWEDKMAGPNTDIWLQSSPKPTGGGGGGSSGSSGGGGGGGGGDDEDPIDIIEEWFDYYMEQMQVAIDELSYQLDKLDYELEGIIHPLEETIEDYERLSGAIDRQIELLERQRKAMIDPIQDEIDALEKAKDIEDEQLELAEKKLAVEEAKAELQNAQNERNIRYFNAEKGQWEWMADKGRVADAEEAVKDAEKELADFEYEMYIRSLERQIEAIEEVFDDKIEELEKEQMVYDDAIYDLEQKVDLITDKYEDRMYPIEREQGALELDKQGAELDFNKAMLPYNKPEGDLASALGDVGGTTEEQSALSSALSKAEGLASGSGSVGASKGGGKWRGGKEDSYTKIETPKTTAEMYNELLAEMGVRFGASENGMPNIGNVTTTSNANYVDNSGQTIINGITINGDAESMTLADMLDDAGIHVQRRSR